MQKGNWFQRCYVTDGNKLNCIKSNHKGYIKIDSIKSNILLTCVDAHGNTCALNFEILPYDMNNIDSKKIEKLSPKFAGIFNLSLFENILKIEYIDNKPNIGILAEIFKKNQPYSLTPSYTLGNKTVYLWDMRSLIPDSIVICDKKIVVPFAYMIPSDKPFEIQVTNTQIIFSKESLYDTLYLKCPFYDSNDNQLKLHDSFTPLKSDIRVSLKIDIADIPKDKVAIYLKLNNKALKFIGGEWNGNVITFRTKTLGNFILKEDKIGPEIKPLKINPKNLVLRIRDYSSGIKEFKGFLNGNFVPMHYDYKQNLLWAEKIDETKLFKGSFKLVVVDNQNNISIFEKMIN
jgi:hypothetical protein